MLKNLIGLLMAFAWAIYLAPFVIYETTTFTAMSFSAFLTLFMLDRMFNLFYDKQV